MVVYNEDDIVRLEVFVMITLNILTRNLYILSIERASR